MLPCCFRCNSCSIPLPRSCFSCLRPDVVVPVFQNPYSPLIISPLPNGGICPKEFLSLLLLGLGPWLFPSKVLRCICTGPVGCVNQQLFLLQRPSWSILLHIFGWKYLQFLFPQTPVSTIVLHLVGCASLHLPSNLHFLFL